MLFQGVCAEGCTPDPVNLVCYCNNGSSTQVAANDSRGYYCDQLANKECQQHYNSIINFDTTSIITCERNTSASITLFLCTTLPTLPTTSLHRPYYWYTIAVLGSTNILLVIVVILLGIALCFVKQRRTARHRYTYGSRYSMV